MLYERLTGGHAFEGETTSDTLAAVLKTEVNWDALPTGVPSNIRKLVRRCLEKDPKQRLRDIGEARFAIGEALSGPPEDRGRENQVGPPSLRTGQADLPHPAFQLVVLPETGLTVREMGCLQTVQPLLLEESVWPLLVVFPTAPAASSTAFTQNAAQSHTDPAIQFPKDRRMAVSEIREPAV